jgi:nucleotide-binding universal stress UspA family protein
MTIVVGIDGSSESLAALQWAVEEGRATHSEVKALMAWNWLDQVDVGEPGFSARYDETDARRALDEAIAGVAGDDVSREVICDLAVPALQDASVAAELLVMGARGKGGFAGLRLGSVSERLLETAACPVAVIREDAPGRKDGPVVVGIDGSAAATAALDWAVRAAVGRGTTLDIVHAWTIPAAAASPFVVTPDISMFEDAARGILDDAAERARDAGAEVTTHTAVGGITGLLLERSQDAALITVGSRGRGRILGTLLGSVSRQVVHHASCPVVVVRT